MDLRLLPHHRSVAADDAAIDEERRLCYVGVTRAKSRLTLTTALHRMKWGKSRDSIPSRFLYELIGKADHPKYQAIQKKQPMPQHPKKPSPPRRKTKKKARP
jgi:DNA helicase II / ATP-dependent DNA helicase PcrA